jgi:uncharacterized protein YndB with AHSA1/START domain
MREAAMNKTDPDRAIQLEIEVEAGVGEVWSAWTTNEGVTSFFAPSSNVDLRIGGAYEMLFDPGAEPGRRGGEGARILAFQEGKMLSFTWNAPPHMPEIRKQWTHVVIRLFDLGSGRTHVSLKHDGWGEGRQWDEAFDYFLRAWGEAVLPRLRHRFASGPVDWDNPPSVA